MPARHCGRNVAAIKRYRLIIVAALVLAAGGAAIAATTIGSGRIGPSLHITGNGRLLSPPGPLVTLGHFPTGGALTPDGRFYWTVSTGRALNDIRIVAVGASTREVIQILPLPGASGGIAIDRNALASCTSSGVPTRPTPTSSAPGSRAAAAT